MKENQASKKSPAASLEQAVCMPLNVPDDAKENLLALLYRLAIEGDLRAAKLYLDYSLRVNLEASSGLTLEEALALVKQNDSDDEL